MGRTERRFWDDRALTSRAAMPSDSSRQCFDAYVPHEINGWEPELHVDTWRQISMATERCLELAGKTGDRPLAAEWLLDRAESIASSTIEEIRPSARRVARAEAQLSLFREPPAGTEMQALRNVAATQAAINLAGSGGDLSIDDLRSIHITLMGEDDRIAGQIRERQNWVGSGALGGPLEARHVGPPPEAVEGLLADLVAYINRDDGIPLVRAAVAHAQFETIHPFPDGNGRTGRALAQFMLQRDGLAGAGALPISSALRLQREQYFDALDETRIVCDPHDPQRSQALRPWVEMLARATDHACVLRERLSNHVDAVAQRWEQQARRAGVRPSSGAFRLLKMLPQHPVVTAESAAVLLSAEPRTAQRAVSRLARLGILEQRSAGKRNRVFECADMMDAFTESAREQPAANLTLDVAASSSSLAALSGRRSEVAAAGICGALTRRGEQCRHPRPRSGGKCPAGHHRP
ncbi:MAG: Fic family protein [Acidimicrobiales bacterium]|nr:Fic family protein [Acidimicrobiales bacterium]MYB80076.1 Fic family protein [Acidimicrobiales bacterium]MYI12539.1 Fic family protein [Acidimicrobiales bacterium]